jgi:hypothetical protein
MAKLTRRALMHKASLASVAGFVPGAASTEGRQDGFFHAFLFQWKPEATTDEKTRAANDIGAFQGKIPGLLETHAGTNVSPHGKGYTFGGVMRFQNKAAFEAYVQHPAHQALLKWLIPLIDAIELDLKA